MKNIESIKEQSPQKENILLRPSAISAFLKALPFCVLSAAFLWLAIKLDPVIVGLSEAMVILAVYKFVSIRAKSYFISSQFIQVKYGIFCRKCIVIKIDGLKCYTIKQNLWMHIVGVIDLTVETIESEQLDVVLRSVPHKTLALIKERVKNAKK